MCPFGRGHRLTLYDDPVEISQKGEKPWPTF
jgi:hypothetical protein